jgi:hypothetical protein
MGDIFDIGIAMLKRIIKSDLLDCKEVLSSTDLQASVTILKKPKKKKRNIVKCGTPGSG